MIRPDKSQYPLSQKFNDKCCRKTYQQSFGMKGHNGLDIAIPCGKRLYASHTGKVYLYTDPNGYGLAVFITGGKYESVTAHMSRRVVKTGQTVKEGQLIGYSGTTGFSSGCHCHFGVRPIPYSRNNGFEGYVDPTPLIKEEEVTTKRTAIWLVRTLTHEYNPPSKIWKNWVGLNDEELADRLEKVHGSAWFKRHTNLIRK